MFEFLPQFLKLAADGAKMALEYVNSRGGITVKGQQFKLEILLEDNKGSSDGAAAAANKLVYDKKVKFVVGGAQGFINLAIASVTEPAGVLYVAEFNNGAKAELNPSTPLKFFANNDSFSSQFNAMKYLKTLHPEAKTIAFIQIDDGNFKDIEPVVRKAANQLGLEILGDMIGYTPAIVDISPIVQKAIALNPDAVMVGNGPTAYLAQVLKAARIAGYTKPVFSCSNAPPQDVLTIVGQEAATNFFGHGIALDDSIPELPDIIKEIMKIAEKQVGFLNFEQIHDATRKREIALRGLDPGVYALMREVVLMETLISCSINALVISSMYILVALGFALLLSIMGIFNFAHEAVYMLGAYITYGLTFVLGMNQWIALVLSIILAGLFGLFLERVCFRPFTGKPMSVIVMAVALILILETGMEVTLGGSPDRFRRSSPASYRQGGFPLMRNA